MSGEEEGAAPLIRRSLTTHTDETLLRRSSTFLPRSLCSVPSEEDSWIVSSVAHFNDKKISSVFPQVVTMRALTVVLLAFLMNVIAERPKVKDSTGAFLVKISDIPVGSCGSDSYFGLGMMNGSLEECERWQLTDPRAAREYEEYKCKHLRG
ncbi:hypothetical protein NECAME_16274 [Necator americanus]|uniref:Uncharacterized protein n=1 Tax=Necator americanus TaxID=51031 RepID=W2TXZ3_NECAM|nr:hypothetical protein NECAME_16274 [Necator americanus]ETN86549.1 hypothetical protein NECAME_16274 [Necator americanus]